jgi:hypothetical protein
MHDACEKMHEQKSETLKKRNFGQLGVVVVKSVLLVRLNKAISNSTSKWRNDKWPLVDWLPFKA